MKHSYNRRKFIRDTTLAGVAFGISKSGNARFGISTVSKKANDVESGKRIGIIGLDTSHSVEFTKELNSVSSSPEFAGYKVVAAYPKGSADIESSTKRIPGYIEQVKKMGVEIVDSIPSLLTKVDVILLETNDGRPHLEQALPVLKAGKRVFIDKPVAASLTDTIVIFEAAKHFKVPVFSSSSLRFMDSVQAVANGKIGKVLGADTYSPATIEKTHPDFFWYGIHGVEILYTVMSTGCKSVSRVHTEETDVTVGIWDDGRIGTFRGTRTGKHTYGGTAYGENGDAVLGPFGGYQPLLTEIIKFFDTGILPVKPEDTLEIYAFMEAADESKRRKGASVSLDEIVGRAKKMADAKLRHLI